MTTLAPKPGSRATRRLEAPDARADERRRVVMVARDQIVIARSVEGVFMRIGLKPQVYIGVLLRLIDLDDNGFHYEIGLVHRDPDLGVRLAHSTDAMEARAAWSLWSRYFELPMLVERGEGKIETEQPMIGSVLVSGAGHRRSGRGRLSRRPRFLLRRKVGRAAPLSGADAARELSDR